MTAFDRRAGSDQLHLVEQSADPAASFQQNEENDLQRRALGDRMGEVEFFSCRGKNFVQFFF